MNVYLRGKFKVSSIILTGFKQGGGGEEFFTPPPPPPPTTSKRRPKKPTQIRVNGMLQIFFIIFKNLNKNVA